MSITGLLEKLKVIKLPEKTGLELSYYVDRPEKKMVWQQRCMQSMEILI